MDAMTDPSTPQWKRDLIQRIRNNKQNKWFSDEQEQQLLAGNNTTSDEVGCSVHQPNLTARSSSTDAAVAAKLTDCDTRKRNDLTIMVKDRVIECDLVENGVSADEELHYGPGIVKKLKNHYLSLTLRECNAQVRPSILPLRKATSLENLLDDDDVPSSKPLSHYSRHKPRYKENETKNFTNNRYYNAPRGVDLKRARSVEAISRGDEPRNNILEPPSDPRLKHQSFHEEMLLIGKEGNGFSENADNNSKEVPFSNTVNRKINRPKRITPLMSEREKPPVDVVKQTKRLFEGKPEQRTKQTYQTGDVAAKIATYKNIITKCHHKKPPIKQKPTVLPTNEERRKSPKPPSENGWKADNDKQKNVLIPDVSLISSPREENCQPNLSETPDLILHSSPVKNVYSPAYRILATANFLKAEIVNNQTKRDELTNTSKQAPEKPKLQAYLPHNNTTPSPLTTNVTHRRKVAENKTDNFKVVSPIVFSSLTLQEVEKNHINSIKTVPKVVDATDNAKKNMEVKQTVIQVPKSSRRKANEQNSIVFKFTDRTDVPDYVYNDGQIRTGKIEKPKVGEGGIILLPGVSLDETIIDDGDDWMLILEGPPSPCDIEFVNGNILIDGRSSLSQKSKNSKMKITFVESLPEVYEYPSEASLASDYTRSRSPLKDISTTNSIAAVTTGTSLANYIPKLGSTEEFQLGVTRHTPVAPLPSQSEVSYQEELQELEKPVLFSSGTNSDILF